MTTSTIDSAGDERTQNNAVRHAYRTLSEEEKAKMVEIKDLGAAFIKLLRGMDGTFQDSYLKRDLQLANDHVEDAVMRAVRHLTK